MAFRLGVFGGIVTTSMPAPSAAAATWLPNFAVVVPDQKPRGLLASTVCGLHPIVRVDEESSQHAH